MSRISSMLLECTITYNKIKTKFNKKSCYITGHFFPNRLCSHWFLWGHMTYNNKTVSRQSPTEILGAVTLQNLWRRRVTVQCYPRTLSARWGVEIFIKGYNKSVNDWSLGKIANFISFKSQCLLRKQSVSVYLNGYHDTRQLANLHFTMLTLTTRFLFRRKATVSWSPVQINV